MKVDVARAEEKQQGDQGGEEEAATEGGSRFVVLTETVGKGASLSVKRCAPRPPVGRSTSAAEDFKGEAAGDIATNVQRAVNAGMRAVAPDVARKVATGLECGPHRGAGYGRRGRPGDDGGDAERVEEPRS